MSVRHVARATAMAALALAASACWWSVSRASDPRARLVPGTSVQEVATKDGPRRFVLHVPATPSRRLGFHRPYPLLLLLHGSSADGRAIEAQSGMDSLAERHHVVVAYPDGARGLLGRVTSDWNAGECCGYAQRSHVDDVGFLRAIIEDLSTRLPIDQRRVYVGGFSDGGRMAYRAACEMPDRVAAVAVVSGSLQLTGCTPARAASLLAIHGTADDDVPYDDAVPDSVTVAGPPGAESTPPSLRYWARLARCTTYAARHVAPRVVRGDFGGCARTAVTLLTLEGGTHQWPDGDSQTGGTWAAHEDWASETIMQFLLRQRR